jgi:hypothetical protein
VGGCVATGTAAVVALVCIAPPAFAVPLGLVAPVVCAGVAVAVGRVVAAALPVVSVVSA